MAAERNRCFVCGEDNAAGLHVHFERASEGSRAIWTPPETVAGSHGIVHGGIVATLLDEAMAKAISALGLKALTAELRVRYRAPVPPGSVVNIHGWVVQRNHRLIETEASITATGGSELAHAWGIFMPARRGPEENA